MKIFVVQESNWIARGPHQSHHLLERLVQRGHETRVIDFDILWRKKEERKIILTRTVRTAQPKAVPGADITVIRPSIIQAPVLEYVSLLYTHRKEIIRQLDEFKPDVVLGFGILNARMAIALCHQRGIPFVYYCIDELHRLVPQRPFRRLACAVERSNYASADLVLSINEGLRDYTIGMGAPRTKTQVIRAGVDLAWFSAADREKKRQELGLGDGDLVLFFMGWLYDFSGLKEVIDGLIKRRDLPNLKLLVVGNGDLWDYIQEIKAIDGMDERVITVGWQPYETIPDFIAAGDICLLPAQKNEIMQNIVPIKMYEYMAAGKPVIATSLSGLKKEFGAGNGVVYIDSPGEAVTMAIELANNGTCEGYGRQSRLFVEPNDWETITDCFEKSLELIIRAT
ncbi:glycosyltransferase family 4 protein [Methanosphaerula subterraneus]|uniref:glycosyltransferase family 4 protein n=1 Tax=Methanosphaerula subterraneus TaxID=3350244 RepID=UPI003F83118D